MAESKKQKEIDKKKEHKRRLQEAKKRKRRAGPDIERALPVKLKKQRFLIVCEGENTEVTYFRQFRLTNADIQPIGEGYNTISLINRTIKILKKKEREGVQYDQVWCVFDKDDFKATDFNGAVNMAKQNNFKVAYSNQAFEYWFILHFEDHQGGRMHRSGYGKKINSYLKQYNAFYDYKESKNVEKDFFEIMLSIDPQVEKRRMDIAVTRAKRLYLQKSNLTPASQESVSTVFQLIEELLRFE